MIVCANTQQTTNNKQQKQQQLEKKSKLMGHADDAKRHKQKIKRERHQKRAFMKNESAEMSSTVIDKTEK